MSLKAIHILFITASTMLAFGFSAWSFRHFFSPEGAGIDVVFGTTSLLAAVGLIYYGKYFLKKVRNIKYL